MPYAGRYRRRYTRRPVRRRSRFRKRRVKRRSRATRGKLTATNLSPGNKIGLPDVAKVKLRLQQYNNVQSPTNPYATHIYRLNSIHDPDFSGVGGQAPQHDTFAAIYKRYKVTSCRYRIEVFNLTASIPVYVSWSWGTTNPTGIVSTYANTTPQATEDTVVRTLAPAGSTGDHGVFTGSVNIKSVMGKMLYDDVDAQAAFGASPTNTVYGMLAAQSLDSSTAVQTRCNVSLTFYCTLRQEDQTEKITVD